MQQKLNQFSMRGVSSWFHTSHFKGSSSPTCLFIYKFWVSSKCPAWWLVKTRSPAEGHCSFFTALVLSSAANCSHPTSTVPPARAGGFSWPDGKCHSLKHTISLGWNLKYFSNVICIYSYSLCPSLLGTGRQRIKVSPQRAICAFLSLSISLYN